MVNPTVVVDEDKGAKVTEENVQRFRKLFEGLDRRRTYVLSGEVRADGKHEGRGVTLQEPILEKHWRAHLEGRERLGVTPCRVDGTTTWGLLDIDVYQEFDWVSLYRKMTIHPAPFSMLLCRSKSGGPHLFTFTHTPVPAAKMKAALKAYLRGLDIKLEKKSGGDGHDLRPNEASLGFQEDGATPGDGTWANLPHFGETCVAVNAKGEPLTLVQFLDAAERVADCAAPGCFDVPAEADGDDASYESNFQLLDELGEGDRNDQLKSVAYRFRVTLGLNKEEVDAGVRATANLPRCNPPYDDARWLDNAARHVMRFPAGGELPKLINTDRGGQLLELGRHMRALGHNQEELTAVLAAVNAGRCRPMLAPDAIPAIVGKALKGRVRSGGPKLLAFASDWDCFHCGSEAAGYVAFTRAGHREVLPVEQAEQELTLRYLAARKIAPPREQLVQAVDTLKARCAAGQAREVHVRIARGDTAIYVDLGDPEWRCIEITATGYRVVAHPQKIYFRRPGAALPLPLPVDGRTLQECLRTVLNVADDDQLTLACGWLLGALHPSPVASMCHLVLSGAAGSAKTSAARTLICSLDPTLATETTAPKSAEDVFLAGRECAILGFDNLSGCPQSISDNICCLSTGASKKDRTLYTNAGLSVFDGRRVPVVMNGIAADFLKGDLLDRSIVLGLVKPKAFISESRLRKMFAEVHPEILGALCRTAVTGLASLDSTPEPNTRMSSFLQWVNACALSGFEGVYLASKREEGLKLLEFDQVAAAIVHWGKNNLHEPGQGMTGTMKLWLSRLNETVFDAAYYGSVDKKTWPSEPASLARHVPRIAGFLGECGLQFEKYGERKNHGQGWILTRIDEPTRAADDPVLLRIEQFSLEQRLAEIAATLAKVSAAAQQPLAF